METIQIKKLYEDALIPQKSHDSDAGYDLHFYMKGSDYIAKIAPGQRLVVNTGIAISLPELEEYDIYARVAPRSGLACDHGLDVLAGVVDRGYTGEINVALLNTGDRTIRIKQTERIAQLIPTLIPKTEMKEVTEFKKTDRGNKGFGSSGKGKKNANKGSSNRAN